MTRAYNTATTQQNSGGAVNPFAAGKNKIINGDFGVWQRGTSINLSNGVNTFTSDRWRVNSQYTSGTSTLTRQAFTPGNAITGYEPQYYMRYTAASGTCSYADFFQPVEDVQTFAGQTVTISFWAKASVSTGVTVLFQQNFGTGGSGAVNTFGPAIFMTTSWARYTATVAIPSISGKTVGAGSNLLSGFYVGTHTSNQTIDIWGVQLETGSVATPFQTATGTIQGELAACQRYYYRTSNGISTVSSSSVVYPLGLAISTTQVLCIIPLAQTMRAVPTSLTYSGIRAYDGSGFINLTSINLGECSASFAGIGLNAASGFTQYRPTFPAQDGSAGFLAFNAEL
jgi:hypothetical protein